MHTTQTGYIDRLMVLDSSYIEVRLFPKRKTPNILMVFYPIRKFKNELLCSVVWDVPAVYME